MTPWTTPTHWPLQSARDQLSQLVKAAARGPQTVTVHDKPAALVLSPQSYARLKNAPRKPLSAEPLQPGLIDDADAALFNWAAGTDDQPAVLT